MLKNEKQKTVTLWDLYLQKIQKYAKVNQANLWYKWYQIDLMAEKENAKDETKRNVIINLCKLMVEIKLNNSFIKKTLDELIKINELIKKIYRIPIYIINKSCFH